MASKSLFSTLIHATKVSNSLPQREDYKFHKATNPAFKAKSDAFSKRLLSTLSTLTDRISNGSVDDISTQSDEFDRYEIVTDAIDMCLERVDTHLDDHKGKHKSRIHVAPGHKTPNKSPQNKNKNKTSRADASHDASTSASSIYITAPGHSFGGAAPERTKAGTRPQDFFIDKIDNSVTMFTPRLTSKPHAKKPLDVAALTPKSPKQLANLPKNEAMTSHLSSLGIAHIASSTQRHNPQESKHPYQYELKTLKIPESQMKRCKETLFLPMDETPVHWVSTAEQVHELKEKLVRCTEIAVDLEHHDLHSFQGITCLMQISTREEDFLVDTLAPQVRESLEVLNEAFADPSIVKVLHGATQDIEWLQRDFGLYIVNMFDTYHAAKRLEFQKLSLKMLVQHYVDVTLSKKYQMSDWRLRPMSINMLRYAQMDTHYLLYIYDRMKNELITKNETLKDTVGPDGQPRHLLKETLSASRGVCQRRFNKTRVSSRAHIKLLKSRGVRLSEAGVLRAQRLVRWRDGVAREEDEGINYVLPNHVIAQICGARSTPRTVPQLLRLCNPVPKFLRKNAKDVVELLNRPAEELPALELREDTAEEKDEEEKHKLRMELDEPDENDVDMADAGGNQEEEEGVLATVLADVLAPVRSRVPSVTSSQPGLPSGVFLRGDATVADMHMALQRHRDIIEEVHKDFAQIAAVLGITCNSDSATTSNSGEEDKRQESPAASLSQSDECVVQADVIDEKALREALSSASASAPAPVSTPALPLAAQSLDQKYKPRPRGSKRTSQPSSSPPSDTTNNNKKKKKKKANTSNTSQEDFVAFDYSSASLPGASHNAARPADVFDPHNKADKKTRGRAKPKHGRKNLGYKHKSFNFK